MRTARTLIVITLISISICFVLNNKSAADRSGDIETANKLKELGEYEKAAILLTDIADTDPTTAPKALFTLAFLHRETKQFEKAIDCYKRILSEYPASDQAVVYYWLGMTYEDANKPDDVIETYKTHLMKFPDHPTHPDVKLRLAEQYHRQGQSDLAIEMYNEVARNHPDRLVKAYYLIGMCCRNRGSYEEAIEAFKAGLAKAPPSTPGDDPWLNGMKYQIVECYQLSCEWEKAIDDLQSLAKKYPDDAAIYYMGLGDCYAGQYDYDKAIAVYAQVADKYSNDPRVAELLFKEAELLEYQEKLDEKLLCLERIAKDYPTYWRINDVLIEHAETLKLQGKYDDAVAELQRIAEERPNEYTKARFQIGLLYRDQKMYDRAIAEYRKGIEEVPASVPKDDNWLKEMKIQIAECFSEMKDFKSAQAQYKSISIEYPDDPVMKLQAASCGNDDDQDYDAQAELYQLIETVDDSKDLHAAYFQIAERLWRNGRSEEAITLLDELAAKKPSFKGYALIVKAELYTYNLGRHVEAVAIARQLLAEGTPDPIGTRTVLINALQNSGQSSLAIEAIKDLLKEDLPPGDKANWSLRIGNIYLDAGQTEDAATAFGHVCKMKNVPSDIASRAMYHLAICYRKMGTSRIARQCMNRVIKLYPDTHWAKEADKTMRGWDYLDTNPKL